MAAPHITGLAALILAHRPEFQGLGGTRSPDRVDRLFQIIRLSARRVSLADQSRIGHGMPDALVALGLPLSPGQQPGLWPGMVGNVALGSVPGLAGIGVPGGSPLVGFGGLAGNGNAGMVGGFPPGQQFFGQSPLALQMLQYGYSLNGLPPPRW